MKSPGKAWQQKLTLDAPKESCSIRVTVVQTSAKSSSDQLLISSGASSGGEVRREEPRSLDSKKDQNEIKLSPKPAKLMPSSKPLHPLSPDVSTPSQPGSQPSKSGSTTPLQPGSQSSKSGSATPLSPPSRPKVIVNPVARIVERHQKETQEKEDASKMLSSSRKRSIHRSAEADSDTESTPRSRQHGVRLRLAPPESKKKRMITASSMVTRTQKRVERNVSH